MQTDCPCKGINPGCVICTGSGLMTKRSCQRCGGTGRTGGVCVDCRGLGWREIDNEPAGPVW